jgi:hypothetical protein
MKAKIIVALAGLALISLSPSSEAGMGAVSIPGTSCVEAEDYSPEIRYANEQPGGSPHALYDNTDSTTFICPITRTSGNGSSGMGMLYVAVRDRHPSLDITCTIASCAYDQSTCSNSSTSGVSTGTGSQALNLGNVATYWWGASRVTCSIPPKTSQGMSGVISYMMLQHP